MGTALLEADDDGGDGGATVIDGIGGAIPEGMAFPDTPPAPMAGDGLVSPCPLRLWALASAGNKMSARNPKGERIRPLMSIGLDSRLTDAQPFIQALVLSVAGPAPLLTFSPVRQMIRGCGFYRHRLAHFPPRRDWPENARTGRQWLVAERDLVVKIRR